MAVRVGFQVNVEDATESNDGETVRRRRCGGL